MYISNDIYCGNTGLASDFKSLSIDSQSDIHL